MILDSIGHAMAPRNTPFQPPTTELSSHGALTFQVSVAAPGLRSEVTGFEMGVAAPPESEVTTRRLVLRMPVDTDRSDLLRLTEGIHALTPDALADPDEFAALLDVRAMMRSLDQRYDFVVVADDVVVGVVALTAVAREHLESALLSVWIADAYTDRDYAIEAVVGLLGYAFEGLQLHRVEMMVLDDAHAEIALAGRVGFREEGQSPRYAQINGKWRDHLRFAMTAEDWANRLPAFASAWGSNDA